MDGGIEVHYECDKGWYPLVERLISDINSLEVPWVIIQIKQKFGALRFYYDVIEPTDEWRSRISNPDYKLTDMDRRMISFWELSEPVRTMTLTRIKDLVHEAESRSIYICELCGQPGARNNVGYIRTLCQNCLIKT